MNSITTTESRIPMASHDDDDENDINSCHISPYYAEQETLGGSLPSSRIHASSFQPSNSVVVPENSRLSLNAVTTTTTTTPLPTNVAECLSREHLPHNHHEYDDEPNPHLKEQLNHPDTKNETDSTIRWVMTGIACLLFLSACLTMMVALQYRFLLLCVWIVLLGLFMGLVLFVRETVLCVREGRQRRVFHPAVHAVADWIAKEIQDLVEDCREEYRNLLLLANDPAFEHYQQQGQSSESGNQPKRRKKSQVFRLLVRPMMRWTFGRGKNRRNRREKKGSQQTTDPQATTTSTFVTTQHDDHESSLSRKSTYLPPQPPESELLSEMEMV